MRDRQSSGVRRKLSQCRMPVSRRTLRSCHGRDGKMLLEICQGEDCNECLRLTTIQGDLLELQKMWPTYFELATSFIFDDIYAR